ncbi:hypothetical protein BG261_08845 [Floricoccus tropicus]|uniref:Mur ligase central domain-containing protein n=1 Tax=Floricoccus tropicus TaxID=1859473 RepID=A0A1E8GQI3_9LACT|nr:hypothetical protein BG261_08845 [Floricoccus tropicus]
MQNIIKNLDLYIDGYFERDLRPFNEIKSVDYFGPSISPLKNKKNIMYVSFTKERRSYVNRREVNWTDGNVQVKEFSHELGLVITERPIYRLSGRTPQFIVKDSWKFMLEFSELLRSLYKKEVIGVTGSVGKTSTRMMISHLLSDENVVENNGNHNVRFAIPLYMNNLVKEPDAIALEISLNALNDFDTGDMSQLVRPTIGIVTSVGEAHTGSFPNIEDVAHIKSKIFHGLVDDGCAIINKDIDKNAFEIVYRAAKRKTDNIYTYSINDKTADVFVLSIINDKYYDQVTIQFFEKIYTYRLGTASDGMILNSLAAILTIWSNGKEVSDYLEKFNDFHSLPKILEKTELVFEGNKFLLLDDTHNAAVPSMLNAIRYSNSISDKFKGKKIFVVGQVMDLGVLSRESHIKFMNELLSSNADFIFGYGDLFKELFEQINSDNIKWFDNLESISKAILNSITDDSFVMLKGSMSGSDFKNLSAKIKKDSYR